MIRLTRAQVREIDRRSIEEYHIPGIVLMENAASEVAKHASSMLRHDSEPSVTIVCGGGNNAGDGLAVARKLHNYGWPVHIVRASEREYAGDAAINYQILDRMGFALTPLADAETVIHRGAAHLVIDALFGTGLTGAPRPEYRTLIDHMNGCALPILAVDIPSGMDCDTGQPLGACVRAKRTVSFVAEKAGFADPAARQFTGEVFVGDIGCPRELIDEVAAGPR
jgi:NAD(P)H-hydrate epimerase